LAITALFFFQCSFIINAQNRSGNGNVVEEDRALSGFKSIEVEDGIDLYLHQGNAETVTVKADENLIDYIRTEVRNGILMIYSDKGIRRAKAFDVYVNVIELEKIMASSGSDVYCEDELKTDELAIRLSSGSDLKMELKANFLTCKLSGGSDVDLKGEVKHLVVDARGGSDVKARRLLVEKCQVEARGGSDVYVNVEEELDALASGASDIHNEGNPQKVHQKARGASDIYGH